MIEIKCSDEKYENFIERVNALRLKTSGYSSVAEENAALQAYSQAKKDFIELLGGEQ